MYKRQIKNNLISLTCDGADVMNGNKKGVAALWYSIVCDNIKTYDEFIKPLTSVVFE